MSSMQSKKKMLYRKKSQMGNQTQIHHDVHARELHTYPIKSGLSVLQNLSFVSTGLSKIT
jgi:hypothetical protein